MKENASPADIINLWPTIGKLAEILGEKYPTVAAWRQRNSIPPDRWLEICAAAEKEKIRGVTPETLAKAHARSSEAA